MQVAKSHQFWLFDRCFCNVETRACETLRSCAKRLGGVAVTILPGASRSFNPALGTAIVASASQWGPRVILYVLICPSKLFEFEIPAVRYIIQGENRCSHHSTFSQHWKKSGKDVCLRVWFMSDLSSLYVSCVECLDKRPLHLSNPMLWLDVLVTNPQMSYGVNHGVSVWNRGVPGGNKC